MKLAEGDEPAMLVNRWFGRAILISLRARTRRPPDPPAHLYLPATARVDLEQAIADAISLLPEANYDGEPESIDLDADADRHDSDGSEVGPVREGIIDTPPAFNPATGKELVPVNHFTINRQAWVEEIAGHVLFVVSPASVRKASAERLAGNNSENEGMSRHPKLS